MKLVKRKKERPSLYSQTKEPLVHSLEVQDKHLDQDLNSILNFSLQMLLHQYSLGAVYLEDLDSHPLVVIY